MARISYNGTTNSQGVASTTITGQGLGRLKYISQCGELLSNEYEISDYGFYDEATQETHKTVVSNISSSGSWLNVNNGLSVEYSSNGTKLTNIDSSATNRHLFYHDTIISTTKVGNYNSILNNSAIEFELIELTGTIDVYLTDGLHSRSVGLSSTGSYKIVLDGESIHLFKDGVEQTLSGAIAMTGTNVRFSFLLNSTNESMTFRNLKIYRIFTAPKHYTPISLSSNSSIIQTGESATLTATLTNVLGEPMANTSVDFIEEDTVIATAPTNSQGVASTSINSKGTGERTFKASKDNVESDNTTIEDDKYYNDGTDLSTLTIPSNTSVTVEDGALKIITSTSGEKKIPYSFSLTSSDNYIFECEIAKLGTGQPIALYVKDSTTANGLWFAYDISTNKWNGGCITSFNNITTSTLAVGDKIRIKQENGVFTLYHNDMVIKSITRTLSGTYSIGHYTNSGRIQYIDNIKLWSI